MVLPVVSGEPVVFPVQREDRAADAVADASNACAEIAVVFLVFPKRIIAKDCVRPRAAMMHPKRADRRAILHDLHGQRFIFDAIGADSFPVFRHAKRLLFHRDRHGIFSFHSAAPPPFLLLSAQLRSHQISFKSRFSGTSGKTVRRWARIRSLDPSGFLWYAEVTKSGPSCVSGVVYSAMSQP